MRITAVCLATALAATPALAASSFSASLTGAQEVPPVQTDGTATAQLTYDPQSRTLGWTVTSNGLSGPATMAHFHGPAPVGQNAPPVLWLVPKGQPVPATITGQAVLTPEQAQQFAAGQWYINLHTKDHPNGEVRAYVSPPKT